MRGHFFTSLVLLSCMIACLGARTLFVPKIVELREKHELVSRNSGKGAPPEYVLTNALLGGFRGMFLTTLWMRAQSMKNEGQFHEMVDIYNIITKLEPGYPSAWRFQAWDLAFNVSVEYENDIDDRVFWVFRGMELLRNQGIVHNPRDPDLYAELAWIFYFKIGDDMDYAYGRYRNHLAKQVVEVIRSTGKIQELKILNDLKNKYPTDESILKIPAAKGLRERLQTINLDLFDDALQLLTSPTEAVKQLLKNPQNANIIRIAGIRKIEQNIKEKLNMDVAIMYELSKKYGNIDWRLPQAHSLYWSWLANKIHYEIYPERYTLAYDRYVYFSLISMAYRGQIFTKESGEVYGLPDYTFLNAIVRHMDERISFYKTRKERIIKGGFMSGYVNFLRSAAFNSYLGENKKMCRQLLDKIVSLTGEKTKYGVSVEKFVASEIKEWLTDLDKDRAMGLIQTHITKAFWSLVIQNDDRYSFNWSMASRVHAYCAKEWDGDDRNPYAKDKKHIPTFFNMEKSLALAIFQGQSQKFSKQALHILAAQLKAKRPKLWGEIRSTLERSIQAPPKSMYKKTPAAP